MRNKDIIKTLRSVDEQTAQQLGEAYLTLSEEEHERLIRKIEDELRLPEAPVRVQAMPEPEQVPRFSWLRHTAVAAACMMLFCGSLAGVVWLKMHPPAMPDTQTSVSDVSVPLTLAHSLGESYAVPNLVSRGELQMTVRSAAFSQETGLYEVTLELWSEGAKAQDGSQLFYADNFLVAVGEKDGSWETVSPCAIGGAVGNSPDLPYCIKMNQHMGRELILSYDLNGRTPLAFVTNRQKGLPYTELTEESP